MMLLPSRNHRPVWPIFLHWQDPGGSSQTLQTRPAGASGPVGVSRLAARSATTVFIPAVARPGSANLPARPEGFTAAGPGAASANLPVLPVGFITAGG